VNHLRHLVFTVVTGGLWAVGWILLSIGKLMRPWRCESCGWHKPEFGRIERKSTPTVIFKKAKGEMHPKFYRAPWDVT
jgi:hypothetical protein